MLLPVWFYFSAVGCESKSNSPASTVKPAAPIIDPAIVNEPNSPAPRPTPTAGGPVRLDLYGDPLPVEAVARLGSLRMLETNIRLIEFSKNKDLLVSNTRKGLAVWDSKTGRREFNVEIPKASWAFALHPQKDTAVIATLGGGIEIWNLTTKKPLIKLPTAHRQEISRLCFLDNNTVVSASEDRSVAIWDISSDEFSEIARLEGTWKEISALDCDGFGRLLVWGDVNGGIYWLDRTVENWSQSLGAAATKVNDISISRDGSRIAVATGDGNISIWPRTDTGRPGRPIRISAHDESVDSVEFSRDGKTLFSSGGDKYAREWNVATGALLRDIPLIAGLAGQNLTLSPDGAQLASWGRLTLARGTESRRFWLWSQKTGARENEPERHQLSLTQVVTRKKGQVTTASRDGTIKTWSLRSGKLLRDTKTSKGALNALIVAKTGNLFSGGKDSKIRVEDTKGRVREILEPIGGEITSIALDGDRLVTGDETGRVWTFSLSKRKRIRSEDNKLFSQVNSLAIAPQGSSLAIAGSNNTIAINNDKGRVIAKLERNVRANLDIAFSPDGSHLAAGTVNYTVELWKTTPYAPVKTLEGHDGAVTSIAFSPDGKLIASGSNDSTVRLWRMPDGFFIREFVGHEGAVTDVAFSHDGLFLVSASEDQTGLVWQLPRGN